MMFIRNSIDLAHERLKMSVSDSTSADHCKKSYVTDDATDDHRKMSSVTATSTKSENSGQRNIASIATQTEHRTSFITLSQSSVSTVCIIQSMVFEFRCQLCQY